MGNGGGRFRQVEVLNMNPEQSRAVNLRILQAELRSVVRGCARMAPAGLATYPGLLTSLVALADLVAIECEGLEASHNMVAA